MKYSTQARTLACAMAILVLDPVSCLAQGAPTIVPGHETLEPGRIQPHRATWRLMGADGREQGTADREVQRVVHVPGEPAILVSFHLRFPQRSALDLSYLDANTLLPFARYLSSTGGFWVHYQSGDELVASHTSRQGGAPQHLQVPLSPGRFNGGVVDLVLASLPLEAGFTAVLPTLGGSGTREALTETMAAEVTGTSTLELPDGRTVEVWRVVLDRNPGRTQVVHVAGEAPYLIRREVLGDDGSVVQTWELSGMETRD